MEATNLLHSDERRFQCVFCDKSFKSSRQHQSHVDQFHSKERAPEGSVSQLGNGNSKRPKQSCLKRRPSKSNSKSGLYRCVKCNKSFNKSFHLKEHAVVHSNERPFKCSICFSTYKRERHLRAHHRFKHYDISVESTGRGAPPRKRSPIKSLEASTNAKRNLRERSYECVECNKVFRQLSHLKEHLKIQHQGKHRDADMECNVSGNVNSKSSRLKKLDERPNHGAQLRSSVQTKSSNLSNDRTKSQAEVKAASNDSEASSEQERSFKCRVCEKKFKKHAHLKYHLSTHSNRRPFKCTQCGWAFKQKSHLNEHATVHSEEKPFECIVCKKSFKMAKSLRNHLKTRHPEIPVKEVKVMTAVRRTRKPSVECSTCRKTFKRKVRLNAHVVVHTGETPFKCTVCGKPYKRIDSLRDHHKAHHSGTAFKIPPREKMVQGTSHNAVGHIDERPSHADSQGDALKIAVVHSGRRPSQSNLKGDLLKSAVVHNGKRSSQSNLRGDPVKGSTLQYEDRFRCSVCKRVFKRSHHLKEHLLRHTGAKPFKCSTCEMAFRRASELKIHSATHVDEKPYKCNVCGMAFEWSASLERHERIHTGVERFVCWVCGEQLFSARDVHSHRDLCVYNLVVGNTN